MMPDLQQPEQKPLNVEEQRMADSICSAAERALENERDRFVLMNYENILSNSTQERIRYMRRVLQYDNRSNTVYLCGVYWSWNQEGNDDSGKIVLVKTEPTEYKRKDYKAWWAEKNPYMGQVIPRPRPPSILDFDQEEE